MSGYITGSRLKVKRAGKHLNELERKVQAFLDRHPDEFTRQLDPDDLDYLIYEIPPNPAPPSTFGPVFGDVVHNLRSALDHIAWNLALLNLQGSSQEPYKFTAFPIILDTTTDSVRRFCRLCQHVLPAAIPYIVDLQPYHRGKPTSHELAILDALWNADKHRVNITIPGRQYVPEFRGPGGWVKTLDDGTRLMRVTVASNPEQNLEPHIRSKVLFEIPNTGERVDLGLLGDIYEMVNSDVIPRFTRFLPESAGIVDRQFESQKR